MPSSPLTRDETIRSTGRTGRIGRTGRAALAGLLLSLVVAGCTDGSPESVAGETSAPARSSETSRAPASSEAPAASRPAQARPSAAEAAPTSGTTTAADGRGPGGAATDETTSDVAATGGTALAAVERLTVKGRAPKTGYDRVLFGPSWKDVDRNGCDTRNDILRRDLTDVVVKPGTHGCTVLRGTLEGPYTGETVDFVKGQGTSTDVQIDHVVSLSDAWQKGAQQLSEAERERLANDPLNLLAVDGPTNQSKSDGDAATWLPPARSGWCPMVARQVAVKARYELWVTAPERDAMRRVLSDCPDEPLPDGSAPGNAGARAGSGPTVEEAPAPSRAPAPTPTPSTSTPEKAAPAPAEDAYYENCAAARAAGAAPLHRGEPGYRPQMDGDSDGVACESRR